MHKARETLERAIHLVENTAKWKARVVYGDTDRLVLKTRVVNADTDMLVLKTRVVYADTDRLVLKTRVLKKKKLWGY